jgi:hypothetical protein
MTNEEAYALGRRLVACKGFRPMRGMRDMQGGTWKQSELFRWWHDHHTPDVRDPATLGCLLALTGTLPDAESLVAALEAAPCST